MRNSTSPVGKREIARAFQIKGADRIALKKVIRELRAEGVLAGPGRKRFFNADEPLPPVAVLSVGQVDDEGDFFAEPENWPHETAAPTIRLSGSGRFGGQIASGARVLARLHPQDHGGYDAKPIRVLPTVERVRFVGVVRQNPGEGFHVVPTDRRQRGYFPLAIGIKHPPLADGDLVQAV
ncbi:MAG: ribonuclease R, partial [Pseudomonadota bacterium]